MRLNDPPNDSQPIFIQTPLPGQPITSSAPPPLTQSLHKPFLDISLPIIITLVIRLKMCYKHL